MGVFVKDNFQGQFVDEWKNTFEKESFEKVSMQHFKGIIETYFCRKVKLSISDCIFFLIEGIICCRISFWFMCYLSGCVQ